MDNFNGGLSVSEVAEGLRAARHEKPVSDVNIRVGSSSASNQVKGAARRQIEDLLAMKAAENITSVGNGVNMHESPKYECRSNPEAMQRSKATFNKRCW